jgi:hypothetical protein
MTSSGITTGTLSRNKKTKEYGRKILYLYDPKGLRVDNTSLNICYNEKEASLWCQVSLYTNSTLNSHSLLF